MILVCPTHHTNTEYWYDVYIIHLQVYEFDHLHKITLVKIWLNVELLLQYHSLVWLHALSYIWLKLLIMQEILLFLVKHVARSVFCGLLILKITGEESSILVNLRGATSSCMSSCASVLAYFPACFFISFVLIVSWFSRQSLRWNESSFLKWSKVSSSVIDGKKKPASYETSSLNTFHLVPWIADGRIAWATIMGVEERNEKM